MKRIFPMSSWAIALGGLGAALVSPSLALAHYPLCSCEMADAQTVRCTGGFSDGSGAPGVTLDVISYDEQVLVAGKLGADSTLVFPKPASEFYVLFDAGPGHTVEIEHADIH
ncbi:hypothetical protein [Rhodospirillum rubrum]|uniref:Secreted protein n=1 Tax=Rhodospirillum rubrum (strain ATCC 11170 / ATH 1.1.1 / DSM 467 / LMG 4362 / NCIMB 8255 / S1) TaxID=269796 RepID=Q2RRQ3_RHORT|nr:hypothetical protein [Rhodospirillum rubrum]ABC23192.1 conserved hypothetical protein [Rhodospirillum rubrum ATCC 11170]AEO48923.1 hypothetical protein F11_12295 [Rhodospirillum rubrum F11]MBK5954832.1 hypothetical protein [Rhodospirillum rubrum]QXG79171.1 hypothetical protein KUL73_12365 [Rhodospirillum rubrum]HAQ01130.1 hypothetical protein [Rhodospirillum rubrum]